MPSNSMPGYWKQRKQAFLNFPANTRGLEIQTDTPAYLKKVQMLPSTEDFFIFNDKRSASQDDNYSFEEAFWFVPNLLEFVEYKLDPATGDVTILPHASADTPKTGAEKITFIFEKILLNLVPAGGVVSAPTTEHPCDADEHKPDTAETTAGSNCMQPITVPGNDGEERGEPEDHFVLFYLKDQKKVYRTDASRDAEIRFNNYLIPTLSADMSMWWYKIPNPLKTDESAKASAEEALKIWHGDRKSYLEVLPSHEGLTTSHYIGVYQRSYFCDELQMRFTNLARIGNDYSIDLEYDIHEFDRITYTALDPKLLGSQPA